MSWMRAGQVVAVLTAGSMAFAAAAVAAGGSHYEAGSKSKPPYVFIAISKGKVTEARYDLKETCTLGSQPAFFDGVVTLGAPVDRHGHFSKTVHYSGGGSTSVSGTVAGKNATVKVHDSQPNPGLGTCSGSHTFNAAKTNGFH